ncbi:MAG: hypothetical protein K6E32_03905, partial [Lachnospiraceae bacterium]|nr:hypothetical protein [Lachnospiraceae bacterium]
YLFGAHLLGAHDVPVVCFACGIIMGVYRDRLARLFEKHAVILSVIFFGIFFSLYLVYVNGVIMGKFPVGYVLLSSVIGISDLAIIGFVISVSHICLKRNIPLIVNPVIALFAEFSLAIYMIQGLCIRFLYERYESSLLYFFAAFFLTLLAAIPLHYLLKLINSGYRKLFRL